MARPYLVAHEIKCNDTTESPEDELYFKLFWKSSNGDTAERRIPDNDGINMRRGSIVNTLQLMDLQGMLDIGNGHTTDFAILVMESDNGPPSGLFEKVRNEVFQHAVSPPGVQIRCEPIDSFVDAINAMGALIGSIAKGDDDFLGMILVQIRNEGGSLRTTWKSPLAVGANRASYRVTNDGADYEISFDVQLL